MQQNKNLMIFLALTMLLVLGWSLLQQQLQPPQKKKALQAKQKIEGKQKPEDKPAPLPVKEVLWEDLSPGLQEAFLAAFLVGSPQPFVGLKSADLVELRKLAPTIANIPTPPQEKAKTVVMGGPKHNLVVTLTTHGAGVQKLVLNKFQAADWRGQPVPDQFLELIGEDSIMPSFLMYHYPKEQSENPVLTLGDAIWKLETEQALNPEDNDQEVRFSTHLPGHEHVRIVKTYQLKRGTYHLGLSLQFIYDRKLADAGKAGPTFLRYQLAGSHGMPIEGEWYTSTFRSAVIGMVDPRNNPVRDLETSDRISHRGGGNRIPEGTLSQSFLQYAGVMNQYFASLIVADDTKTEDGTDARTALAWARPTQESEEQKAIFESIGNDRIQLKTGPFEPESCQALPRVKKHVDDAKIKSKEHVTINYYIDSKKHKIVTWIRRGHVPRPALDDITVRVNSQDITLKPGETVEHKFLLYHGPAKVQLLAQYSDKEAVSPELVDRYAYKLNLRMMTDYGRFYWWSDLLTACTKVMHFLLYYLHFAFGPGMSIILLTVLVRGMMFPISRKQALYSVKLQQLAPEMKKIQEKFKDDAKAKSEATWELYRKHDVHPLGGCLPLMLQMPIFIGLYYALGESIHFRLAKFLWIDNLAAPDMLFYWGEGIPFISDPDNQGGMLGFLYLGPYFNLLPIFAIGLMIAQQIIMTPPPQDEQQAMQFKMMRYMMIIVGIMFYKIAAGLCMYIIISTLWGLGERRLLPKKKPAVPDQPPASPSANGPRTGPSGRKKPPKPQPKKNEGIKKVSDWWADVLKQARKK